MKSVFYSYAAASATVEWLRSDHVETPIELYAKIERLYFLCVVRAEEFP
jgi:hypothetical protein